MNKKWNKWAQWNLKVILATDVTLYSLVQIYCFVRISYLHAGSLAPAYSSESHVSHLIVSAFYPQSTFNANIYNILLYFYMYRICKFIFK